MFPTVEESCSDQLLWKPWDELEENSILQEKGMKTPGKDKVLYIEIVEKNKDVWKCGHGHMWFRLK